MGRYQEQTARRNARYEYEIPDGALHCEIVTGTETFETEPGAGGLSFGGHGVRTWRGVRYLLRLDPPVRGSIEVLEDVIAEQAKALGESLMRARLALTAIELAKVEAGAGSDLVEVDLMEPVEILAQLIRMLVEAGAVDPMEGE